MEQQEKKEANVVAWFLRHGRRRRVGQTRPWYAEAQFVTIARPVGQGNLVAHATGRAGKLARTARNGKVGQGMAGGRKGDLVRYGCRVGRLVAVRRRGAVPTYVVVVTGSSSVKKGIGTHRQAIVGRQECQEIIVLAGGRRRRRHVGSIDWIRLVLLISLLTSLSIG